MNIKFKAVLFDLDGTLLNTLQDLAEAVNKGLAEKGFPQHGLDEFRYFVGEGREEMALKSLPIDHRDPVTLKRLVDFINKYYVVHWNDHTLPYPGITETLDGLTQKGIHLTVFSNKPQEFTSQNVDGLLGRWKFEMVLGASESVPKKPNPSGALQIARALGIKPIEFIYLGDSGIDMQTATAAGMYPVGAAWGFRTPEELKSNGARIVIQRPQELLKLIG
jgi:phosphoglycolate phosphatase